MKKAVLFDLDNTLYDFDSCHAKALRSVHKELSKYVKISFPKFHNLYKLSKRECHRELMGTASSHNRVLYFQRLIEKTHQTVDPDKILRLYNAYWNTVLKTMKPYKGAIPLLKQIQAWGMKIAIVSDLTTQIQLRKIHHLKITKYVDVLVTSEEAGREKPHPSMFLLALNKMHLLPEDVVVVGDNPDRDVEGANAIGITSILVNKGALAKEYKEGLRKPDYVINEMDKLPALLEKINSK